jgi:hypothetical protein
MIKLTLSTFALVVALSTSAFASGQTWNVTEENTAGIKSGQGQWSVTIDGNNKLSGSAILNFDNGKTLTYDLAGAKNEATYTVSMLGFTHEVQRRSNPGNSLKRARQGGATNIHDAVKVEQDAFDDTCGSLDC